MFGLFDNKPYEPLDHDTRKWYENNFLWLNQEFNPKHEDRKIYTPTQNDFPIKWDKSENTAFSTVKFVAESLQINPDELDIAFFASGINEINMGGSTLFFADDKKNPMASGLYYDKDEKGKYTIGLDRKLLDRPVDLISTVAHELCHVKLLGEQKIDQNDEHLTDLATVIFGYGVFNANASFNFFTEPDRWGYQSAGYMKAPEWSYALALSAFYRKEDNPEWKSYLNLTIKKDFERSMKYIKANEKQIFNFDTENENSH
jgi:hypothetical protein